MKDMLHQIIVDLGLSPEEFADSINVGKSTIYKLLRGDTKKLTMNMAAKISKKYPEYSRSYLMSLNRNEEDIPLRKYDVDDTLTQLSESKDQYEKTLEERIALEVVKSLAPQLRKIEGIIGANAINMDKILSEINSIKKDFKK